MLNIFKRTKYAMLARCEDIPAILNNVGPYSTIEYAGTKGDRNRVWITFKAFPSTMKIALQELEHLEVTDWYLYLL